MERSFVLLFVLGIVIEGSALCNPGYHSASNGSCVDINECDNWGTCTQICINLNGGFKCDCVEGYSLDPADKISCRVTGEQPTLLVTHRDSISMLPIPYLNNQSILKHFETKSNHPFALDFLWKEKAIFWSENFDSILSAPVDNFLHRKYHFKHGFDSIITSVAVDWIHDNLYWIDSGEFQISVMTLKESFRKTLVTYEIYEPRALALNPLDGWMYWTDWGAKPSSVIERAGMDGSQREIIVRDLRRPSGITIDFILARLFWVDAALVVLESSNFDGSDRRLIHQKVLKHPYSVTTFEDFVYVSERTAKAVWKINKFTGEAIGNVFNSTGTVNAVQIYHSLRQPGGKTRCPGLNSCCLHMCLPVPSMSDQPLGVSCWCQRNEIAQQERYSTVAVSSDVSPASSSTEKYNQSELSEFTMTETATVTTTSMTSTAGIALSVNMPRTTPLTVSGSTTEILLVATDGSDETYQWPLIIGFAFFFLISLSFFTFPMIYRHRIRSSNNRPPFVTYFKQPNGVIIFV